MDTSVALTSEMKIQGKCLDGEIDSPGRGGKQCSYDVYFSFDSGPNGATSRRVAMIASALAERGLRASCFAQAAKPGGQNSLNASDLCALMEQSERVIIVVTQRYASRLAASAEAGSGASQVGDALRRDRCVLEFEHARRFYPGSLLYAVLDPNMGEIGLWPEPLRSALDSQPGVVLPSDNPASSVATDALVAAMLRAVPAHAHDTTLRHGPAGASVSPIHSGSASNCHSSPSTQADTIPVLGALPVDEDKAGITNEQAGAFLRDVGRNPRSAIQALERRGVHSIEQLALVSREVLLAAGLTEKDIAAFEEKRTRHLPRLTSDAMRTKTPPSQALPSVRGDVEFASAAEADSRLTEVGSLKEAAEVLRCFSEYHVDNVARVCGFVEDVSHACAYTTTEAGRLGLLSDLQTVLRALGGSEPEIAARACGAIRSLCTKDDNQTEAGRLGLLRDIQTVLRAHGSSQVSVAQQACAAVWNICVDNNNKIEAGKLKLLIELQSVLRTLGLEHAGLAEQGCGAVRNICILPENRLEAHRLGLLSDLRAVLRSHGAMHAGVAKRVCGAIWNICAYEDGSCSHLTRIRAEAKALGLVKELQQVRRAHSANKDVQRLSKGAEATILDKSDVSSASLSVSHALHKPILPCQAR